MNRLGFAALDRFLLARNPYVWCLRAHYVVPGSLVACGFAAWLGSSIRDAAGTDQGYMPGASIAAAWLCGSVGLYWCYLQARQRYSRPQRRRSRISTLIAYPVLLSLILLPTLCFDVACLGGFDTDSITGNDGAFLFLAVMVSTAVVATWLCRVFTMRTVIAGAIAVIATLVLTLLVLGMLDITSDDGILLTMVAVYGTWIGAAIAALVFRKLPWAATATLLAAPMVCAFLATMVGLVWYHDEGYVIGVASLLMGPCICIVFDPLLSRYQMHPK